MTKCRLHPKYVGLRRPLGGCRDCWTIYTEAEEARGGDLTARQAEIVKLAGEGYTRAGIGVLLGISAETVKSHIQHAMEATGAKNTTELVARLSRGEIGGAR